MSTPSLMIRSAAIAAALVAVAGAAFWAGDSFAAQDPFTAQIGGMPNSTEHVAHVSAFINAEAGTTPQQKAKIDALLQQARGDFEQAHLRTREDHDLAIALLSEDRIDRGELESLRQNHLRLADQTSKRMTQLVADIATVLTPAQRKALLAKAKAHHVGHQGGHMGHHGG